MEEKNRLINECQFVDYYLLNLALKSGLIDRPVPIEPITKIPLEGYKAKRSGKSFP